MSLYSEQKILQLLMLIHPILTSHISRLTSHISFISRLMSHVSYLTSHSLLSHFKILVTKLLGFGNFDNIKFKAYCMMAIVTRIGQESIAALK